MMKVFSFIAVHVVIAIIAIFSLASCRSSSDDNDHLMTAQEGTVKVSTINLKSSAFQDGGTIPTKYTCDGANISPPLNWSGVPHEAKSQVLIVTDPDAPKGEWTHWVLWNLPAAGRKLLEGFSEKQTIASGAVQGTNDFKKIGWSGPCPPSGTHRYVFTIYALDATLQLPNSTDKAQLLSALKNHVVAQGQLTAKYSRAK